MPTSDRSIDRLVGWFVESFSFVRRKGEATADYGSASPNTSDSFEIIFFQIQEIHGMLKCLLMN